MKKGLRLLFLFLTIVSGAIGIVDAIHQGFEYTIQVKGLYPEVVFPWETAMVTLGMWSLVAFGLYLVSQLFYEAPAE